MFRKLDEMTDEEAGRYSKRLWRAVSTGDFSFVDAAIHMLEAWEFFDNAKIRKEDKYLADQERIRKSMERKGLIYKPSKRYLDLLAKRQTELPFAGKPQEPECVPTPCLDEFVEFAKALGEREDWAENIWYDKENKNVGGVWHTGHGNPITDWKKWLTSLASDHQRHRKGVAQGEAQ
jgi:hypothetical protein